MMNSLEIFLALNLFMQVPAASSPLPSPAPTADSNATSVDPMNFVYNPFGKRDPFHSYLLDHSIEKSTTDALLNFDLSKFKVTGILSGVANPRAIVKDGDNRGHIIYKGTHIGRNRGQVVSISRDQIVVAEEFRDPLGKLIITEKTMKLEQHERGHK